MQLLISADSLLAALRSVKPALRTSDYSSTHPYVVLNACEGGDVTLSAWTSTMCIEVGLDGQVDAVGRLGIDCAKLLELLSGLPGKRLSLRYQDQTLTVSSEESGQQQPFTCQFDSDGIAEMKDPWSRTRVGKTYST